MGTYRFTFFLLDVFFSLLSLSLSLSLLLPFLENSFPVDRNSCTFPISVRNRGQWTKSCQYFLGFGLSLSQRRDASEWGEQRTEDDCLVNTL